MAHVDINELDPAHTVVVATGNAHKVTEIEAIITPVMEGVRFVALGELGDYPDPVEDGETFHDNALIKARAALDATGLVMAVADDSGLCVDALDGAPGIHSARWAGEHGNDGANNEKLLRELADVPRRAAARTSTRPSSSSSATRTARRCCPARGTASVPLALRPWARTALATTHCSIPTTRPARPWPSFCRRRRTPSATASTRCRTSRPSCRRQDVVTPQAATPPTGLPSRCAAPSPSGAPR